MNFIDPIRQQMLRLFQRYRRVLLYGVIGVLALVLELIIFYLLTDSLFISIAISNAAAMFAGLLFSFTLNARYNFRVYDRKVDRFMRFGLVTFGGYLLTTICILGLASILPVGTFSAKLLSLPVFFLFQYNCNRIFTFQPTHNYAD